MTFETICQLLEKELGDDLFTKKEAPCAEVATSRLTAVCQALHTHDQLYFDYLSCLTGIDNGPEAGTMEVIYQLYSIPFDYHFRLKVTVPRNKEGEPLPSVPSVSGIWRTANWHERETYDLLGIHFEGHPDLRRLLLPADWEGYPLRKDYKEMEKYHGIKVAY